MSGNAVDFVKSNGRDRKKKELSQRQICLKRKITKQKENRTERKVGAQCFGCRRVVFFFRFGNFLRGPASPLLVSVDVFFCRIFFFFGFGPVSLLSSRCFPLRRYCSRETFFNCRPPAAAPPPTSSSPFAAIRGQRKKQKEKPGKEENIKQLGKMTTDEESPGGWPWGWGW